MLKKQNGDNATMRYPYAEIKKFETKKRDERQTQVVLSRGQKFKDEFYWKSNCFQFVHKNKAIGHAIENEVTLRRNKYRRIFYISSQKKKHFHDKEYILKIRFRHPEIDKICLLYN